MATINLNLTTFNMGVDSDQSFEKYRLDLDDTTNSNMTKIDGWGGSIITSLSVVQNNTSASLASIYTFITNTTGSISTSVCQIHSIETFFNKIGEFSGSGQADFNSLTQAFNHILILGQASGSIATDFADVGIDFNGDATAGSYLSSQWVNSGSSLSGSEIIIYNNSPQIVIGTISGSTYPYYAGSIMAIIPYYSGSGEFYKCAMGFNALSLGLIPPYYYNKAVGTMGGFWQSTSAITRIRIFARQHQTISGSSLTKYNFLENTKISLYGFI